MNLQLLAVIANGPAVLYYLVQKLRTREIYYVTADESHKLFNGVSLMYLDVNNEVHYVPAGSPLLEAAQLNPALVMTLAEGQKMIKNLNAMKLDSIE